jgi:hypothetical protein
MFFLQIRVSQVRNNLLSDFLFLFSRVDMPVTACFKRFPTWKNCTSLAKYINIQIIIIVIIIIIIIIIVESFSKAKEWKQNQLTAEILHSIYVADLPQKNATEQARMYCNGVRSLCDIQP